QLPVIPSDLGPEIKSYCGQGVCAKDPKWCGVMHNPIRVYLVWYRSFSDAQKNLLRTFIRSFSSTEGTGAPLADWWRTNTLYYDCYGRYVSSSVILAKEHRVRRPLKLLFGLKSIRRVVKTRVKAGSFPLDEDGVYFVIGDGSVAQRDNEGAMCSDYCGWHDFVRIRKKLIKVAYVGSPVKCPSSCWLAAFAFNDSPNSDKSFDSLLSTFAHELAEATSDPYVTNWYDAMGQENADICAWNGVGEVGWGKWGGGSGVGGSGVGEVGWGKWGGGIGVGEVGWGEVGWGRWGGGSGVGEVGWGKWGGGSGVGEVGWGEVGWGKWGGGSGVGGVGWEDAVRFDSLLFTFAHELAEATCDSYVLNWYDAAGLGRRTPTYAPGTRTGSLSYTSDAAASNVEGLKGGGVKAVMVLVGPTLVHASNSPSSRFLSFPLIRILHSKPGRTGTLSYTSDAAAYNLEGVAGTKFLIQQNYDPVQRTCVTTTAG
ncbi:unnamed protein product, partial [Closterium sp. NIES-65]